MATVLNSANKEFIEIKKSNYPSKLMEKET